MVVNQHVFLIERIELFSSNLNYSTSRIALTSNQGIKITGSILPWSSGSGAWPSYFGPNKYWEHALSWWRLVFLLEKYVVKAAVGRNSGNCNNNRNNIDEFSFICIIYTCSKIRLSKGCIDHEYLPVLEFLCFGATAARWPFGGNETTPISSSWM